MNQLEQRELGETGVNVTALGLGTVPLSGFKVGTSYADFEKVVLAAFDRGIRYFDCAPMYGLGKSEHFLGHALRVNGLRDKVVISTKVARVLKPASRTKKLDSVYGIEWIDPLPFLDTYDYTYDGIMRAFEDSQQRLGLDFIDVLLVHDVGRAWHGDQSEFYWDQLRNGGYRALDELRAGGSIKAIGLGVNETDSVLGVAREFDLDCSMIAGRYTLLNHGPLRDAFPELQRRNISVIAAGVFNSGVLATGTKGAVASYDYQAVPESVLARVRAIEGVCERYDVDLPTAALQFVYAHPAVATVVQGVRNVEELIGNIRAISEPLPSEFWAELKTSGIIPKEAPVDRLEALA